MRALCVFTSAVISVPLCQHHFCYGTPILLEIALFNYNDLFCLIMF